MNTQQLTGAGPNTSGRPVCMVVDPRPALIRPGLWLGGACNEQDLDWLRSAGITHIAQIGRELWPSHPSAPGLSYLRIALEDHEHADLVKQLPRALDWIQAARGTEGASLLVHCAAGMSRSPSILLAHLALTEGLSFAQALRVLQAARPCVCPNTGFVFQLQDWIQGGCTSVGWRGWGASAWAARLRAYRSTTSNDTPGIRSRVRMQQAALVSHDASQQQAQQHAVHGEETEVRGQSHGQLQQHRGQQHAAMDMDVPLWVGDAVQVVHASTNTVAAACSVGTGTRSGDGGVMAGMPWLGREVHPRRHPSHSMQGQQLSRSVQQEQEQQQQRGAHLGRRSFEHALVHGQHAPLHVAPMLAKRMSASGAVDGTLGGAHASGGTLGVSSVGNVAVVAEA